MSDRHRPTASSSLLYLEKPVALIHMDFNRQRVKTHRIALPFWFAVEVKHCFAVAQSPTPVIPKLPLEVAFGADSAQFSVASMGEEYLTGGVAWGLKDRVGLYAFLSDYHAQTRGVGSSGAPEPPMPNSLPWLGTVAGVPFDNLESSAQAALMAWARQLALALIHHALTGN